MFILKCRPFLGGDLGLTKRPIGLEMRILAISQESSLAIFVMGLDLFADCRPKCTFDEINPCKL